MNESDKTRITLAVAFIVIYITIIFSLPNILDLNKIDGFNIHSFLILLIYVAFIFIGAVISILFFIYIFASAHGLAYEKDPKWILEDQKCNKIKKYTFDNALKLIHASLYIAPGMVLGALFSKYYTSIVGDLILKYRIFLLIFSILLLLIIFVGRDKK